MALVRCLRGVRVEFSGEPNSGWLPPEAAVPPATPARVTLLDFEIREESGGFLLLWSGPATTDAGDTWHPSLDGAIEQARLWFGIDPRDWEQP